MTMVRRIIDGVLWVRPIHRWTTVVTIAFFAGALLWMLAVAFGWADIAKSPNDIVLDLYRAAQERRVEDLRAVLSEPAKSELDRMPQEEVDALMARLSNEHTTTVVEFLGVKNYGSHAVVGITQGFSDGLTRLRVEVLAKEGGRWRVEWPVGEAQWAESNLRFDPYYRAGTVN